MVGLNIGVAIIKLSIPLIVSIEVCENIPPSSVLITKAPIVCRDMRCGHGSDRPKFPGFQLPV